MGAVVTSSVPPYTTVCGNPARALHKEQDHLQTIKNPQ